MGVGGVGADGDVGAVLGDHAFARDGVVEVFDHAELVGVIAACADSAAHLFPAGFEDGVELLLRLVVGGDLGFGEDGFELADEVGGGDDLLAEAAEEFGGSGVDHGDVHDGVARGVLHGDFGGAGEEGLEFGFELLPGGVLGFGAGEGVEAADSMRWTSFCGSPWNRPG